MKTRLRSLWDQVSPEGGPCPQPTPLAVRRRVDATLDQKPRAIHPWRALRLAAVCAAALALLTGTAVAAGALPLPAFNALSVFYGKGDNAPGAEGLVEVQPVAVSNDLFTVTLTSSLADENIVYFTAAIQAKTRWAQTYLDQSETVTPAFYLEHLSETMCIDPSAGHYGPYDRETLSRGVDFITALTEDGRYALHVFDPRGGPCKDGTCPGGDCRVEFTVSRRAETYVLEIDADGTAAYKAHGVLDRPDRHPPTLPVHLQQVELSPLSLRMLFLMPPESGLNYLPEFHFLWKDGTTSTAGQVGLHPHSSHGEGREGDLQTRYEALWVFDSIQDLSRLEALVFEGTAYPLDGGASYEVDMDSLPRREAQP